MRMRDEILGEMVEWRRWVARTVPYECATRINLSIAWACRTCEI